MCEAGKGGGKGRDKRGVDTRRLTLCMEIEIATIVPHLQSRCFGRIIISTVLQGHIDHTVK